MKNKLDFLTAAISLVLSLAPLLDDKLNVLPVNPLVREDLLTLTIFVAVATGLGAWVTCRYMYRKQRVGWISLLLLLIPSGFILAVASTGLTLGLSPAQQALGIRAAYFTFFVLLAAVFGAFLGLAGGRKKTANSQSGGSSPREG